MYLQIRDPRARELAQKIAQQRQVSMTEAVIQALETEYRQVMRLVPLTARLSSLANELAAITKPGGRDMTKSEIDAMLGHC